MPQTAAAKKALRASARRRTANDRWRQNVRKSVRVVVDAIVANNAEAATKAMPQAESMLDRAARRHVIHHRTVARRKSRLRAAIARLTT